MSEARIGTAAADYESLGGVSSIRGRPPISAWPCCCATACSSGCAPAGRHRPIETPPVVHMAADLRDDLVYAMVSTAIASGGVARGDVTT